MSKYGFIYLWHDSRYKRFYLGRHWGTENDGYICSSNSMRDAHRRRPQDFRRRIVSYVHTSMEDLVVEEQRWLDMIDKSELGEKYYNKTQKSDMPSMRGRKHTDETKLKMSQASKGKPKSEAHKEAVRQANLGKTYSKETNKKKGRVRSKEANVKVGKKVSASWIPERRAAQAKRMSEARKSGAICQK